MKWEFNDQYRLVGIKTAKMDLIISALSMIVLDTNCIAEEATAHDDNSALWIVAGFVIIIVIVIICAYIISSKPKRKGYYPGTIRKKDGSPMRISSELSDAISDPRRIKPNNETKLSVLA